MSRRYQLHAADALVAVEHKAVRYLRLRLRADGAVRLSAPLHASRAEVQAFLEARTDWLRRQRTRLAAADGAPRFALRDGETLPFAGAHLQLRRIEGRPGCRQLANVLQLSAPCPASEDRVRRLLLAWYRARLETELARRVPAWAKAMRLPSPEWGIRNMHSRWGSCNPARRRISIALRLMAQPSECLDYVIVHELAHLREPWHDSAFWAEVARAMPAWRVAHDRLRAAGAEPGLWRAAGRAAS